MWESRRFTVACSLFLSSERWEVLLLYSSSSPQEQERLREPTRMEKHFGKSFKPAAPLSTHAHTHRSILSRQYLFCHKAVKPVTIPLSWMTLSSSDGLLMESSGPIRYLSTKLLVLRLLANWGSWTEAAALLLQQERTDTERWKHLSASLPWLLGYNHVRNTWVSWINDLRGPAGENYLICRVSSSMQHSGLNYRR